MASSQLRLRERLESGNYTVSIGITPSWTYAYGDPQHAHERGAQLYDTSVLALKAATRRYRKLLKDFPNTQLTHRTFARLSYE